ncbi:MAG TPA: glycosyltransferase family 39 protein [Novosphingobium sp.]|nr:glycosyltransferase family 39 protein [Novosphingobium sp.]
MLILLAAALLRLIMIDQPFVDAASWRQTDTAGFAQNFYQFGGDIFTPHIIWNGPGPNPAGYEFQTTTFIASILYHLFGQHDLIGRAISIFFGLWTILALFLLVSRVWTKQAALFSALVLAAIPGEIYVDRSFLPDPVMLSLVVTSAWGVVAYLQTGRAAFLAVAWFAGTLGLLTKVAGAIVALPLLYALIVYEFKTRRSHSGRGDRGSVSDQTGGTLTEPQRENFPPESIARARPRTFLLPVILAAVAVLVPVAAYYVWALHLASLPPHYVAAGDYWVWKFGIRHFLENRYFIPDLSRQLAWFWTRPLALVVALGFLSKPLFPGRLPYFFHAWLVSFGIYYVVAARGLVHNPTNLNLMNPAAAALATNFLFRVWQWAKQHSQHAGRPAVAAVMIVLLGLFGKEAYGGLHSFAYYPWSRADYHLGLEMRRRADAGDLVVTSGSIEADPTAIYYSRHRGWVFPPLRAWSNGDYEPLTGERAIALLEDLRGRGADWYGIVNSHEQTFREIRAGFLEHLEQFPAYKTAEFTLYDLNGKRMLPNSR